MFSYTVYLNTEWRLMFIQMEDVYEITYDTCGQYWPKIHHYIFLSVTLVQITMIGLFGLKSLEFPSPQFPCLSIKHEVQIVITNLEISFGCRHKISKQSDELAEAEGTTGNLDDATSAYKPPWMHPTNLESSSAQPLNV